MRDRLRSAGVGQTAVYECWQDHVRLYAVKRFPLCQTSMSCPETKTNFAVCYHTTFPAEARAAPEIGEIKQCCARKRGMLILFSAYPVRKGGNGQPARCTDRPSQSFETFTSLPAG